MASTDALVIYGMGQFTFASDLEVHSMANRESRKHARDFMASFD
jgi:hypothetical protein